MIEVVDGGDSTAVIGPERRRGWRAESPVILFQPHLLFLSSSSHRLVTSSSHIFYLCLARTCTASIFNLVIVSYLCVPSMAAPVFASDPHPFYGDSPRHLTLFLCPTSRIFPILIDGMEIQDKATPRHFVMSLSLGRLTKNPSTTKALSLFSFCLGPRWHKSQPYSLGVCDSQDHAQPPPLYPCFWIRQYLIHKAGFLSYNQVLRIPETHQSWY
jgi:hypothetical protein